MADSPMISGDGNVKITISSEGSPISDSFRVISLLVSKKVNKIPYAQITFLDGDMPNGDFPLSNQDVFKPGKSITIEAGYGQNTETIFEGIVIKHGIQITGSNASALVVELKDKAVKMTVGRKSTNYTNAKDSDVISTLIGNCAGLTADVGTTNTTYKQLVQYYATDWDFMLSRAEANGLLVIVDNGTVTVKAPETSASAVLKVTYGIDLKYFKADVDASEQLSSSKGVGWSISDQATLEESGESPSLNKQGNLSASDLAAVLNVKDFQLQSATPLESTNLQALANACLLRAGMSGIKGRMEFQGHASASPGVIIELDKLGDRFNGNVYISAVQHHFNDGNWITEAEFGLPFDWYFNKRDVVAPPASGFIPAMDGLQVGVVEKLDGDPDGESRIQVKCPMLGNDAEALWARLSNFYGFNQYGSYFIPEVGSEVIVGFFNNDPRFPVILGSLYSSKNAPPYTNTSDNYTKAFMTQSKLKIEFDDENKIINIETPGGNKVVISDKDKSILLNDQNSNKVELNASGITLDSPKDINIKSQSKITLDGTGGIAINSSADVKLTGLNIEQKANVSYTAKGTASAEFSASGNTTVKGALVMIN